MRRERGKRVAVPIFGFLLCIAILFATPAHAAPTIYDYANRTQGTDIFAYDGESPTQVPTTSMTPSNALTAAEYDYLEIDDGAPHSCEVLSKNSYAQMRFVIHVDEDENIVGRLDAIWNGQGINTNNGKKDGASLYIWNYASAGYELLQASADTEAEVSLAGSVTSDPASYIGGVGQNEVVLLVVSNDKYNGNPTANELFTDYMRLEVDAGYFTINHDGTGIHCAAELISITAKDAIGDALINYTGSIILNTQTGTGTWRNGAGNAGVFLDPVPGDGLASYTFSDDDDGSASFFLDYPTGPSVFDVEVWDSANPNFRDDDSEGNLSFGSSGFTVTASPLPNPPPDPINDPILTQTAGAGFVLYLTAYGTTATDTECGVIESYGGSRTLKFWSTYSDPASGTINATIDGSWIATAEGSASGQIVSFSSGQAAVTAKYKDVGEIRIRLKDDTVAEPVGGMLGATHLFVVKPADLVITTVTRPDLSANPGTSTPPDEVFVAAGGPFHVTLEARDAEGARTPNYGNESFPEAVRIVSASVVAPPGGRNGTGDDGSIGNGSSFVATMPAGTFTGTTFYWDEVGAMRLQANVADGSYLGAGDVTGSTSGVVGRFTPFDFAIAYNAPLFRTACSAGGFSYLGQGFDYFTGSEPVITATARNAQGVTTQNYTGSWFRLQDTSLAGLAYASGAGTLSVAAPNLPSVVEAAAGVGTISFDNGPSLSFVRSSPLAPFDAEIQLGVDVIDADGIAYSGNPATFGTTTPGGGIAWSTGKSIRFGRAFLENAHGPEVETLAVPLTAQYYDGVAFVPHTADACTSLGTADLSMTPNPGGLSSTPTIANAPLVSGEAGLSLSAPGPGNTGYFELAFDLSPAGADLPFLRSDADDDGVYDDNPTSRATFGIFPGNDAIIYLRELY
jgi:MSHA biogenesis protein MshQ